MLGEETQVPAQLLPVHRPPVLACRGAADMDELGARREQHLPARLAEAVAPVRLLAEHEEVLVEEAYGSGGLPPYEQAGAHQELGLAHLVVVEAGAVERIQGTRAGGELAQEEVLRREPPERRKPTHRALQRPVGIEQARAD